MPPFRSVSAGHFRDPNQIAGTWAPAWQAGRRCRIEVSRAYRYHTLRQIDSPVSEKYFWTVYTPGSPSFVQGAPERASDYFITGGTADELRQELGAERSRLAAELAAFREAANTDSIRGSCSLSESSFSGWLESLVVSEN